jgi:hypothetical protein
MKVNREEIRAALEKATPGPWKVVPPAICDGRMTAKVRAGVGLLPVGESMEDKRLIANAPSWLAGLLEELEEAERKSQIEREVTENMTQRQILERQRADAAEARAKELEDEVQAWRDQSSPTDEQRIAALEAENARLVGARDDYRRGFDSLSKQKQALEAQLNGMREALRDRRDALRKQATDFDGVKADTRTEEMYRGGAKVLRAHADAIDAALSSSTKPEPDLLDEVIEESGPGFAEKVEAARKRRAKPEPAASIRLCRWCGRPPNCTTDEPCPACLRDDGSLCMLSYSWKPEPAACRHLAYLDSVDVARRPIRTCSDCGERLIRSADKPGGE